MIKQGGALNYGLAKIALRCCACLTKPIRDFLRETFSDQHNNLDAQKNQAMAVYCSMVLIVLRANVRK